MMDFYTKDHEFTKDDFETIRKSFYRFCSGEQTMCVPVQKNDDDMILGSAINALESQYFYLKQKLSKCTASKTIQENLELKEKIKMMSDSLMVKEITTLKLENAELKAEIKRLRGVEYE